MSQHEIELLKSQIMGKGHTFNPFPGLRPFGFEESHLFFGREGQSDEVLLNLARHRFTAVIGASGSGKSSLMYCGLIPVLYGGFMTQAGSDWNVIVSRPGIAPIENLSESILLRDVNFLKADEEEQNIGKTITSTFLRSSSMGLVDALKQVTGGSRTKNVLLLIDQFEELFRFVKANPNEETYNEASSFVNLIIKSVTQNEIPIYVALTMRSDFIGDCAQFPELTHLINKSHYLIPQMTREQQRLAIEGPVAVAGGKITKRLVQQLLNDVGNSPDQLPILQHALMRTWDYWVLNRKDSNEPIDLKDYIAVGKISEALSQHANEAYSELNTEQKVICEKVFKELTEKGKDNSGIRRAVKLCDIVEVVGVPQEKVVEVIEVFRKPGRSLLMPSANVPLNPSSVIEISHESLMRIWNRLRNWVEEESDSANMYKRISEAAEMYQVGKTSVWRPPDLQLALNWQKKQNPTVAWAKKYNPQLEKALVFIKTSETFYENERKGKELLQRRMLRRTRRVAIVLGFAAIISGLFFVFGWIQKIEYEKAAEDAKRKEREALVQKQAAELNAQIARRQTERAEVATTQAERQKELAIKSEQEAIRLADVAKNERAYAEAQTQIAEEKKREAVVANEFAQEQRHIAENARDRAYELRLLSISQSMAVKSLTVGDQDLKSLLALHSYKFHHRYSDYIYDKYVYDGLYHAARQYIGEDYNVLNGHSDLVRRILFSKDRKIMYSTGSDGKILEWDTSHNTFRTIFKHDYINYDIELSNDEKWLIVGGSAPYILAIDLVNFHVNKIYGHHGVVTDILFLPGQPRFLSLGIQDQTLRINDFEKSSLVKKFDNRATAIAMDKYGKLMAVGNELGELILWNNEDMGREFIYKSITDVPIRAIAFDYAAQNLAVGTEDGVTFLCDISSGIRNLKVAHGLTGQRSRINDIAFSRNGKLMATASWDGSAQVWIMDNLDNLPLVFLDYKDYVWCVEFSNDDKYILTGTRDGKIKYWPTDPAYFSEEICNKITRKKFTRTEWLRYVGADIPFEITCE